jgi:hypothetical protein
VAHPRDVRHTTRAPASYPAGAGASPLKERAPGPGAASVSAGPITLGGLSRMAGIVLVGAQWGDEGKGKITDLLADDMDSSFASRAVTMRGTPSSTVAAR